MRSPTESKKKKNPARAGQSGSVLLVALMLVLLLAALSAAVISMQRSNLRQSSSFLDLATLRQYAESGIAMCVHGLRYCEGGNIGSTGWTSSDDLGTDGASGTGDLGEGDGVPTPGEPGVSPVSVGPAPFDMLLAVHVFVTGVPGIERIVASCTNGEQLATVEHFVRRTVLTLPRVGAVYVPPDVVLDLKGDDFLIDGNDYRADGSPGSGPSFSGIATPEGLPSGANAAALTLQIPLKNYDQVLGAGDSPSVGEVTPVEFSQVFADLRYAATQTLPAGKYTGDEFGDFMAGSLELTHVQGDLKLSGEGRGAGVLLVDGNLEMSGEFTFHGLIMVRGDVSITGGGVAGIHVFGSLATAGSLVVSGNADLFYSTETLDAVDGLLATRPQYSHVMYDER